jgi:hypothetical protein
MTKLVTQDFCRILGDKFGRFTSPKKLYIPTKLNYLLVNKSNIFEDFLIRERKNMRTRENFRKILVVIRR